jgi:EamA-like transporter family
MNWVATLFSKIRHPSYNAVFSTQDGTGCLMIKIQVVGQSFWLAGLRYSSLSMASSIASFAPIAGILAAYFILGEAPTQAQYIGGSVVLLGILLSQFGIRHRSLTQGRISGTVAIPVQQAVETQMGFKGI